MEVIFINTGFIFNLNDKKGIMGYLQKIDLDIPNIRKSINQYLKFEKEAYFVETINFLQIDCPWEMKDQEKRDTLLKKAGKKYPDIMSLLHNKRMLRIAENFFIKINSKNQYTFIDEKFYPSCVCVPPVRIYEHLLSLSFIRDERIYKPEKEFVEAVYNNLPWDFLPFSHTDDEGRITSHYDRNVELELRENLINLKDAGVI